MFEVLFLLGVSGSYLELIDFVDGVIGQMFCGSIVLSSAVVVLSVNSTGCKPVNSH